MVTVRVKSEKKKQFDLASESVQIHMLQFCSMWERHVTKSCLKPTNSNYNVAQKYTKIVIKHQDLQCELFSSNNTADNVVPWMYTQIHPPCESGGSVKEIN